MLLLGAWVNCLQFQENLSNILVVLMLMLGAASVTYHLVLFVVLLMNILFYMSSVINAPFILVCMIMSYFYNTLLFACNLSVRCDE